jgi:hypothetical protein
MTADCPTQTAAFQQLRPTRRPTAADRVLKCSLWPRRLFQLRRGCGGRESDLRAKPGLLNRWRLGVLRLPRDRNSQGDFRPPRRMTAAIDAKASAAYNYSLSVLIRLGAKFIQTSAK